MVQFKATLNEANTIQAIADRAKPKNRLSFAMDLEAAHSNGCPLDFQKLKDFDDFNFWHDVNGIQRNIDRRTGKLLNCFVPRCAL